MARKAGKKKGKRNNHEDGRSSQLPFNIDDAAKEAGVSAAHLRLKLREAKVKKPGKAYGWETKAAMLKDIGSSTAA